MDILAIIGTILATLVVAWLVDTLAKVFLTSKPEPGSIEQLRQVAESIYPDKKKNHTLIQIVIAILILIAIIFFFLVR